MVAGDGPERIHGEWWRRDGEVWAVRDYYRVEDEAGGRFWLFRRGDGVDQDTGDLSWWMHGLFGMTALCRAPGAPRHFSFLRGASCPEELFAAAALLGYPALGVSRPRHASPAWCAPGRRRRRPASG